MNQRRSATYLGFLLAAVSSFVLVLLIGRTPWGQSFTNNLGLYLTVSIPGIHGVLIAESALSYHRKTRSSKSSLIVELICAGLLVLVVLLALITQSLLAFYGGLILAAIATFLLTLVGAIEVIKAVKQKRDRSRNIVRLLLNSFALLVYCLLAFSLTFLVALGLAGESYMGN